MIGLKNTFLNLKFAILRKRDSEERERKEINPNNLFENLQIISEKGS